MGAQRRPFSAPIHSCFWRATHQCSGIESTRSSVKFCSDCQLTFSFMFSQIVTPIVTSLHHYELLHPPARGSSRTAVIAGSAVAGIVVLIITLATLFIMRRRVRRQCYWAFSRKRLPSRATFLAGDDMDLPFPSPPFASADHDDSFANRSIHRINTAGSGGGDVLGMSPYTQSFYARSQSSHAHAAASSSSLPPRLLRARASGSGSIFQEAVWPPPVSQLMVPLTSASQRRPNARHHRCHGPASSRTRNGTASFFLGL